MDVEKTFAKAAVRKGSISSTLSSAAFVPP